jgi:hypothetical protein
VCVCVGGGGGKLKHFYFISFLNGVFQQN